ncbi:MAG: transporter substrate-binding domain-containing protein [Pseudomonadota bacterium]
MRPFLRLVMLCALLLGAQARAEVVDVYTSANFAPLMLGDGRGIYPDLIAQLNRKQPGGLTFRLRYMPRKRLQVKLEEGSLDGLVIGMMPEWLADPEQKKYLWTAPFSNDRFALVSLATYPVSPDSGAKREGRTVGITTGYVYPGLTEWFSNSHLQRSGGVSDEKNIEKLLLGRVDCVIVAESMARYFIRTHKLETTLRMYPMPGPISERRFLVQRKHAAVYRHLAPAIQKLAADPQWRRATAAYE